MSHGSTVLATGRDGFLHAVPEQGFFVDQTRLVSRYRYCVDGAPPLPLALSNVGQDRWLGYYLITDDGDSAARASLSEPSSAAQQSIELRVSRRLAVGMHEDLDLADYTQRARSYPVAGPERSHSPSTRPAEHEESGRRKGH